VKPVAAAGDSVRLKPDPPVGRLKARLLDRYSQHLRTPERIVRRCVDTTMSWVRREARTGMLKPDVNCAPP
jgi:hypothetical protein